MGQWGEQKVMVLDALLPILTDWSLSERKSSNHLQNEVVKKYTNRYTNIETERELIQN